VVSGAVLEGSGEVLVGSCEFWWVLVGFLCVLLSYGGFRWGSCEFWCSSGWFWWDACGFWWVLVQFWRVLMRFVWVLVSSSGSW
jgi:hypothetical protein